MTADTVIPFTYSLVIPQRATLRTTFRLPFDGRGKSVYAQVWKDFSRRTLILDLDVEVIERTPRFVVEVQAEWEDTALVKRDAVWDLLVVNADGTREHWISGPASLSEAVTEATP